MGKYEWKYSQIYGQKWCVFIACYFAAIVVEADMN